MSLKASGEKKWKVGKLHVYWQKTTTHYRMWPPRASMTAWRLRGILSRSAETTSEDPLGKFFPSLSQGLLQLYKSRGSNVIQRKWLPEACPRHAPLDSSQATWLAYPFAWCIPAPGSGSQRRHDGEGRCRPWACSSHPQLLHLAKQLVGVPHNGISHQSSFPGWSGDPSVRAADPSLNHEGVAIVTIVFSDILLHESLSPSTPDTHTTDIKVKAEPRVIRKEYWIPIFRCPSIKDALGTISRCCLWWSRRGIHTAGQRDRTPESGTQFRRVSRESDTPGASRNRICILPDNVVGSQRTINLRNRSSLGVVDHDRPPPCWCRVIPGDWWRWCA